MFEKFTKKPFTDRLKDTGYLLKNSFKVIGKDKDIIKPTVHMVVLSIILTTLFFGSLLSFFTGRYVGWGILVLLVLIFILTPFKFFYYIRQKADQSWIVYNTICGKDISYSDAHNHTKLQKSNLRKIALIEILMKYVGSQRSRKGGIGAVLINLFLAALVEIWDLLSHYMIPAVVVEQKPLKEIVPQIKALKNNVPATLVGVFGIDFVGNVIGTVLFPIYLLTLAIGAGIGYLLVSVSPNTVWTISGFSFSWIPVFIAFYIVFVIGAIIRKIVESTKVIYFTIFYTAIRAPANITKDMRGELTHYLRMEKTK
ncbi:MAG: hypothetical protein KKF95_04270 [Nanoarchaeota archaeon]|nr:hypothetical protein [Nanoarchaeota archaeon]MBU2443262.1 hypothetical protein [Nanoarchaeota archaeon]